jgi:hypothetical protein
MFDDPTRFRHRIESAHLYLPAAKIGSDLGDSANTPIFSRIMARLRALVGCYAEFISLFSLPFGATGIFVQVFGVASVLVKKRSRKRAIFSLFLPVNREFCLVSASAPVLPPQERPGEPLSCHSL